MTRANRTGISVVEYVLAAAGLLCVLAVLGYLGYQEVTQETSPPDVTLEIDGIQPVRTGYLVRVRATNHGGQTAAGLRVQGILRQGFTIVETSRASLQYVPPESERKAGLYFSNDPRTLELTLKPEGYESP